MGGHKNKRTFLQKLLPCKSKNGDADVPPPPSSAPPPPYPGQYSADNDNKNHSPAPYTYTNMQNNPYGAYAAHAPVRFPPEIKPGVFNMWGITGYTGSVSTEESLNPEQTYCNLAKIQQSMTGHNQFDPFKFSKPVTDTKEVVKPTDDNNSNSDSNSDSDSDNDSDHSVKSSDTRLTSSGKLFNYATYCPAPPTYGSYKFGIAPPPFPPTIPEATKSSKKKHQKKVKTSKKDKGSGGDNKCKSCAGESGYPVRKIKRMGGKPLCWACVWGMYNHAAQEVWEESEEVKMED